MRVVVNAEEVWEENRVERANISFTSERNFCPRCHILFQDDDDATRSMPMFYNPAQRYIITDHMLHQDCYFALIPGIEPGGYVHLTFEKRRNI